MYTVAIDDGREGLFHIESSYPHRIVRWSLGPDIEAQLSGSERLAYWRLNHEGGEAALVGLGLSPAGD